MEPDFELEIDVGRQGVIDEGLVVESLAEADALPEKALSDFRRAARGEPGDPDYAYILGNALAHRGSHAEAVVAFREAIALDRAQPLYFASLGIALWRLGRFDEAIDAFEDALKLAPADAQALNGLGLALLGSGRPTEAASVLLRASGADREAPEPRSNRAVALWRAGRPHDAVLYWQEAAGEWPESPLVLRNLGRALLAQDRLPEARACLQAVARLREDDADARLDLADVLYLLGRGAEADEAYEEAARIDPRSLARRPESLDARRTLVLDRLREDLKPRPAAGERATRAAWTGVASVVHATRRGLKAVPGPGAPWRPLFLFVPLALVWLGYVFGPPYVRHYLLQDDLRTIARTPVDDDGLVHERLRQAVEERGLSTHIAPDCFEVTTRPRWRTITCVYEVPTPLFPGSQTRLRLRLRAREPFLAEPKPAFY
jgi:tetratricopeptide (TPR) repeat protein